MIVYLFVMFLLIGIGRNLPFPQLYPLGVGLADLLVGIYTLVLMAGEKTRRSLFRAYRKVRIPVAAVLVLSVCALVSLAFNTLVYGVRIRDVFEIARYLLHAWIMVLSVQAVCRYGAIPIVAFVCGVVVSGLVAYQFPMNPDVLGTRQIFNPNVIGNVLAVSVGLCSLVITRGWIVTGIFLAIVSSTIAVFTFSKGTWLMILAGWGACYLALAASSSPGAGAIRKVAKCLGYVGLVAIVAVAYNNRETLSTLVRAKIAATEFGASAQEGGSFSARVGLMKSAIYMAASNPLLGVGISNYEKVNRAQATRLGDSFYDDDNPNSAWFYVLGCMGVPAFVVFGGLFSWFIMRLHLVRPVRFPLAYTAALGSLVFLGSNVQLEMLTAYYFWVTLGAVSAWTSNRSVHCAPESRQGVFGYTKEMMA